MSYRGRRQDSEDRGNYQNNSLWSRWWIYPAIAIIVISIFVFFFGCLYTVGAGRVGVSFDPLAGGVQPNPSAQGVHLKWPWVSIEQMSVQTQKYVFGTSSPNLKADEAAIRTVASDGLYVTVDLGIWYSIKPQNAPMIRNTVGVDGVWQQTLVVTPIRSMVRDVISKHTAAEIYGENRSNVEPELLASVQKLLDQKNVDVEQVFLKDVSLPQPLVDSIQLKKQAEQDAMRMTYVLQKEGQEKERKIIEAGGIAKANEIIAGSLTPEYLSWYWLEKLKDHNDMIYVPTNGMFPLFKDIDSTLPGIPEKKVK